MINTLPHLTLERELWKKSFHVIGTDEVGRGSFAGPVYAGAVCFHPTFDKKIIQALEGSGIDDSKRLRPIGRNRLSDFIKANCLSWAIGSAPVSFINKFGIVKATQFAQRSAIYAIMNKLKTQKTFILADAFHIRYVKGVGIKNQKAIVHGDQISLSIAAASIIAKVERDQVMISLSAKFPNYFWSQNKGYGTKNHQDAIVQNGITSLHRTKYVETFFSHLNH